VNHDGKVDLPEFLAGIHMLCHGRLVHMRLCMHHAIRSLDDMMNGRAACIAPLCSMSSRLQTAFAIVDSNHDGAISKAEFFRFISAFMRVLMVAVLHAESLRVHVLGNRLSWIGSLRGCKMDAVISFCMDW